LVASLIGHWGGRAAPECAPSLADMATHTAALAASAVDAVKVYGSGAAAVRALDGVNLRIHAGQFTAVMGPSGSGKSTMMHCLAGLDTLTSGSVRLGGAELSDLGERELTRLRRERVGFVFQSFNLLPALTAAQNIELPLRLARRRVDRERWDKVIDTLGIGDRLGHRPSELSGGEQQRVACARALVGAPEVVFADEPTGNLDSAAGTQVLRFLRGSVDDLGQTIVMVTHDPRAAGFADRVLFLADGRDRGELLHPSAESVAERLAEITASAARARRTAAAGG
jgi:putative ABC transport system ATP-binding protein